MIVGRAAAASRVGRREFVWGDGAAPDLFGLGSGEDVVGFVHVPSITAPFTVTSSAAAEDAGDDDDNGGGNLAGVGGRVPGYI
jgi:hypothetical protein